MSIFHRHHWKTLSKQKALLYDNGSERPYKGTLIVEQRCTKWGKQIVRRYNVSP